MLPKFSYPNQCKVCDGPSWGRLCPKHQARLRRNGSLELPPPVTLAKWFGDRVDMTDPDGCWPWTGNMSRSTGYGMVQRDDGTRTTASRVAWELAYGPIPRGMLVCHHCDFRLCVRPSHLFVGTPLDNNRDARDKGRLRNSGGRTAPPVPHLDPSRHSGSKRIRRAA